MCGTESLDVFAPIYKANKDARYFDGVRLILSKNLKGLRREFKEFPNHAWYCLGDFYFKLGRFGLAKKAFRRSIRYDFKDSLAYIGLANCYSELRCYRMAERVLRRALFLSPSAEESGDILYNLGCALWDLGRFDDARSIYQGLVEHPGEVGRYARSNLKKLEW